MTTTVGEEEKDGGAAGRGKGVKVNGGENREEKERANLLTTLLFPINNNNNNKFPNPLTFLITFKNSPHGPLFKGLQLVSGSLRQRK